MQGGPRGTLSTRQVTGSPGAQECPGTCPCDARGPREHSWTRPNSSQLPQPPRPGRSCSWEGTPRKAPRGRAEAAGPRPCATAPRARHGQAPLQKYRQVGNGQRQHRGRRRGVLSTKGTPPPRPELMAHLQCHPGRWGLRHHPVPRFTLPTTLKAAGGRRGWRSRLSPAERRGPRASRCHWNSHRANYRAALMKSQQHRRGGAARSRQLVPTRHPGRSPS